MVADGWARLRQRPAERIQHRQKLKKDVDDHLLSILKEGAIEAPSGVLT